MYEDIKRNVTISSILRSYGFYAPNRPNFRIRCPIHHGTNLSFSVSERDGLWNCFSKCARGGSVIDLVSALENIDIKEAAEKLKTKFNISPSQVSVAVARDTSSRVERFKEMSREDHDIELPIYLTPLEEGYRGLTQATIKHWNLSRLKYPSGAAVSPLSLPEGVFIPLHNNRGGFCSYSIRTDSGEPKYWNFPGMSKCYPFGLYINRADIVREGFVWIVEGQFDAIKIWQKGYKNVIALQGSSLTERQAMLVLAATSNIMLCLDGDDAGRAATAKVKKQWQQVFDIGIFNLPNGVDPDNYEGVLER